MRRKKHNSTKRKSLGVSLKKFVLKEAKKAQKLHEQALSGKLEDVEDVEAEEVDADKQADALENDIDFMKVLNIQERKLRLKLNKIKEAKVKARKRILKRI